MLLTRGTNGSPGLDDTDNLSLGWADKQSVEVGISHFAEILIYESIYNWGSLRSITVLFHRA